MTWGALPPVGLYVVLAMVMTWCAILTTELREVRAKKKHSEKLLEQASRLRLFATNVLDVARIGLFQIVAFLVVAAFEPARRLAVEGGLVDVWEIFHLVIHVAAILSLYELLRRWLDKGQLNSQSRHV